MSDRAPLAADPARQPSTPLSQREDAVSAVRPALMFGTRLDSTGGVASVLQVYRKEGLFQDENVVYIPTHADGSPHRKLAVFVMALAKLLRMLPSRPRLAHIHMSSNASFWRKLVIGSVCAAAGIPYVIHLHGGGFRDFYGSRGAAAQAAIRRLFDRAAGVIVLTSQWERWVRSMSRNPRVQVIFNPVECTADASLARAQRSPHTVLYLGRLLDTKGLRELIEATALLAPRFAHLELLLGGDGDPGEFAALARERGISERVRFLGWVGPEEKQRLLESSTVLALPSYNEGLPMCILEAMAAGLPVVATAVGGIPEAITDGVDGLLVPVRDAGALAEALARVLDSPAIASRMAERARQKIHASFDARLVTRQLRDFYARCAKRPAA
jgi:glycosyltransferase involved in cell wall biosynthesis